MVLVLLTFGAVVAALPFYPWPLLIIIFILLFAATLFNPFLGLIVLVSLIFPILIFQVPALAWIFLFAITMSLIFGYMHYRTLLFAFMLVALSFSQLGYLLAIPVFIFAVLIVGRKRAIFVTVLFILGVVALSFLSGVQNTAYIVYDAQAARSVFNNTQMFAYTTVNKTAPSIYDFGSAFGSSVSAFSNSKVILGIGSTLGAAIRALFINPLPYLVELAALVLLAIMIDSFAVNSRSKYTAVEASLFGIGYPLAYILVVLFTGIQSIPYLIIGASLFVAPALSYVLQLYNIDIVKALEVRKMDTRLKFGEAFEDLQVEKATEKFSDIGNYENTKKELTEAVLGPIEERGIARAYNITPAKGLLFFGPPGTGKTMMMRALANEIHAGFFYVKTADLISAFPGETEKKIANIFTIAKKHQPCVLFFDEIDSIGSSREGANIDQSRRLALSQLLVEMDGFQKNDRIIVVGTTNVPDILDKALLRAGRIDKIVYMPLPNATARKLIFELYLKKYPIAADIDLTELAANTERYSGADIKAVCNAVAQTVASGAVAKHKVLRITEEDVLETVKETKASTSLAQVEMYNDFKIEFERSVHGEKAEMDLERTKIGSVIGMDSAKKALVDAIQTPLLHPDMIKKYKIKSIKGILLFGPPGTGKTMLMKAAVNDEMLKGTTILQIDGAELARIGFEKANATIKEIFNRARENEPAVVFIDELDGLAPKREGADWVSSEMTTELLRQMDGLTKPYGVVVVAATNVPDKLDPALLRPGRFDKIIFAPPPGIKERIALFKEYLEGAALESVDFAALAKASEGYTGADIANVCREVKTRALDEEVKTGSEAKIATQDITNIMDRIKPSAPKSLIEGYKPFLEQYGQR
jgi:SpoVK/Ycf46/Vps4 family AAA+-type ATPase